MGRIEETKNCNDNNLSKYCEAGNSWDTANATKGAFDQTKTLTT